MRYPFAVLLTAFWLLTGNAGNAQQTKTKPPATSTVADQDSSHTLNLKNTTWQSYFGEPINDTLMIYYAGDSSFVQSKLTGATWVTSIYKVKHDTLTVYDIDGLRACATDVMGSYRIAAGADSLKLEPIGDDCRGRFAVFTNATWNRTKDYIQ